MSDVLPRVLLLRGDGVPLEPIDWIWPGYLPAGMLTLLGGAPGCGKTAIALSLAATLTTGRPWPDGSPGQEAGDVILWSGEDPHSLSAAGLVACGADMQRVHFVERLEGGDAELFDPGRDMALLAATAEALKSPRLLILDPVVSAVAGDGHKNNQVRRSLQPVVDLGRRLGCAVIGITHFAKSTSRRDPVERITGSVAFSALPRLVLVAAKGHIDGQPRRVLVRAKSNIGPDEDGFVYELERVEIAAGITGQRVAWIEPIEGSAHAILSRVEDGKLEITSTQSEIDSFVQRYLAEGPVAARQFRIDAETADFGWRRVYGRASRTIARRTHRGAERAVALGQCQGGLPARRCLALR